MFSVAVGRGVIGASLHMLDLCRLHGRLEHFFCQCSTARSFPLQVQDIVPLLFVLELLWRLVATPLYQAR